MLEILVATKVQLASSNQDNNTTDTTSSGAAAGGDADATIEALHATNLRLEADLDAAQLENTALSRQANVLRDRLNQTEGDLEDALFQISRFDQGGDEADAEHGGIKRGRHDDDDDDATETDEDDERGSVRSYADEEGSRSHGSFSDQEEEANNEQPRGEPDVIDLSDSPPRPKRQRQYHSDQEDDHVAGEHHDYEDV